MKKEAKRKQVTQQACDDVKAMIRIGFSQTEIGDRLGYDASTISKIKRGNYILEEYLKVRRESNEKTAARKKEAEEPAAEEQIAGQMEMELTTMQKTEMSEQTKMMRFQAAQVDKVIMKLDQIYNMASMILRAVRKE